MQMLITGSGRGRSRVVQVTGWQLVLGVTGALSVLMLLAAAAYHFLFMTAARDGWPVVSELVRLVMRDEIAQRERVMRENLDAMAEKVGELQAKVIQLEAMGERVSNLAGVKPSELKPADKTPAAVTPPRATGRGGPYIPLEQPTLEQLGDALGALEQQAEQQIGVFTLAESRLFQARLSALMVPSTQPVEGAVGSGFGFRSDPFTGRPALHTGLDFAVEPGTPIQAAAGGVVVSAENHPAYGNVLEIDHGNNLVTRYAHCSSIEVKPGDIVRRGQVVALSGNTGRSTGPHLHFEVLVEGVPQDPAKFLANASTVAAVRGNRTGAER
jgi:murein DD-endopeptidase MepM/ murein hydrolase activator NlpD